MDGVIVDSEKHWKKAELIFFNELLPQWTKEDQQKIIGLNVHDTHKVLTQKYGLKMAQNEFLEKVNEIAIHVYRELSQPLNGFMDLIKKLSCQMQIRCGGKTKNLKIALTSSSLKSWIDIVLERFELRPLFDVIISAEDINGHGKPEPDIYLFTAKKLDVPPEECIVIEDSENGVLSAKNANMFCIGLRNGFNEKQDLSAAEIEINEFTSSNIQKILNYINHEQ